MRALAKATPAALLLCLAFATARCSSGGSTTPKRDAGHDAGAGCRSNADCPLGLACDTSTGKCHTTGGDAGTTDAGNGDAGGGDAGGGADAGGCSRLACAPDQICVNGSCVAPALCDGGGAICCNTANNDEDCPIGKFCNYGQCQSGCKTSADCLPGAPVCDTANHLCKKCGSNADCPAGYVCDPGSGSCKIPASTDGGGAICTANSDCQGGLVCVNHGCTGCRGTPQCTAGYVCEPDAGTCSLATDGGGSTCTTSPDSCTAAQGQNYVCDPTTHVCKYVCITDSDCTAGNVCDRTSGSATFGQCIPASGCNCAAVTCPTGTQCDPSNCQCNPPDGGACQCGGNLTCPIGYSCDSASCQCIAGGGADGGGGSGTDGTQCSGNSDCASGYTCDTTFSMPPACRQNCACIITPCSNSNYTCADILDFCGGQYPYCIP